MLLLNRLSAHGSALLAQDAAHFRDDVLDQALRFARLRDGYQPTPLLDLPALASRLGVARVSVKDEAARFGLGSFKALGGTYAVVRAVLAEAERVLGRRLLIEDWRSSDVLGIAAGMTFGCATDGNHGRSVAAGAQMLGSKAVIFVHSGVSQARVAALSDLGAEVVRVEGTYDTSIEEATRVCARQGWVVVSDTSWPGYEEIPGWVMEGYTPLVSELLAQMDAPPTHVFVQAGVGGIAATVAGALAAAFGAARPTFVVVEPSRAACLLESALAGQPVMVAHGEPTVMAMLECYEPSLIAWRVLERTADAFMMVEEEDAMAAMRLLADPQGGDPAIVAGESGGAGLAGLCRAAIRVEMRRGLDLGAESRVLVINTEGATDPDRYRAIVGRPAEAVRQTQPAA